MPTPPPARAIDNAAAITTRTLNELCGWSNSFFIGSYACRMYSEKVPPFQRKIRPPLDLDIVVKTPEGWDQEELKRRMVAYNAAFFTVAAVTPGATYRVLKYCEDPATRAILTAGKKPAKVKGIKPVVVIKIDVLIANESLNIPGVPANRIRTVSSLPMCPLSHLVLLRLQGWDDRRTAELAHHRAKGQRDVVDLTNRLLPYASTFDWKYVAGSALAESGTMMADADAYLPAEFMQTSRRRIRDFCKEFPETITMWIQLGAVVKA